MASRSLLLIVAFSALLTQITTPALAAVRLSTTLIFPDIPHLVSAEVAVILNPKWALGLNAGGFVYTLPGNPEPTPLSMGAANLRARWFPFQGTFFLGLIAGGQAASASRTQTFSATDSSSGQTVNVPTSVKFAINSPYITPHLGWYFITQKGFTWGLELGAQIPIASQSSLDIGVGGSQYEAYLAQIQATQPYKDLKASIEDVGNKIGKIPLPHFAIRMGWTF